MTPGNFGPRLYTEAGAAAIKSSPVLLCRILDVEAPSWESRPDMLTARQQFWLGLWVSGLISAAGCSRASHPLRLVALETRTVSSESQLELRGDGLPADAVATLRLRGVLHAPGRTDRSLDRTLPGRVLSPERAVFSVDPRLPTHWGRGTFEGRLELRCDAHGGTEIGNGALAHVMFDIDGPTVRSLQQLNHQGAVLLRAAGVEISELDPLAHGVGVATLTPTGAAARSGVREGDLIERAHGVRIRALADLAPQPSATTLQLQVRTGSAAARQVSIPISGVAPFADPTSLGLYVLASPVLLLLLGLLPLPTPGELLGSGLVRFRALRFAHAPLGLAWACAFGAASALCQSALDPFGVLSLYLCLLVLARGTTSAGWWRFSGHVAAVWLAIACVAAVSGTRSWLGIAADQGDMPWEWNVFARPPLALACVLCLWHAATLSADRASPGSMIANTADAAARGLLSALLAGMFLAGTGPGLRANAGLVVLASLIAGTKSLLVFVALTLMPGVAPRPRARRVWGTLLVVLPLTAAAWSWLAPSRAHEVAVGGGVCVFVLVALLLACLQYRQTVAGPTLSTQAAPNA
jgi:hypothetical protein